MQTQQVTFRIKFESLRNEKVYIEINNFQPNSIQEFEMMPEFNNRGQYIYKAMVKVDSQNNYQYRYIIKKINQIEVEEIFRNFKYSQGCENAIDEWNKIWCYYQIGKIESKQLEFQMKQNQNKNDLIFDCHSPLSFQQIEFWQNFIQFISEQIQILKHESVEMNQKIFKASFNWQDFQFLVEYHKIQGNKDFASDQLINQKVNLFNEQKFQELWHKSFRMIKSYTEQIFAFKIEKEEEKLQSIIQKLFSKINEYSELVVKFLVDKENQNISHQLKQILSRYYFILHNFDQLRFEQEMVIGRQPSGNYQVYAEKVLKQLQQCQQNLQLVQDEFRKIQNNRSQPQQDQQQIEKVEKIQSIINYEHELGIFNLEKNILEAKKQRDLLLDSLKYNDRRQKEEEKELEQNAKMNQEKLRFLENLNRKLINQQLQDTEEQKKELQKEFDELQKFASSQFLEYISEICELKQELETQKINIEFRNAMGRVNFEVIDIEALIQELQNLNSPFGLINSLQKYSDIISELQKEKEKLIHEKGKYQNQYEKLKPILKECENRLKEVQNQFDSAQKELGKKQEDVQKYQQMAEKFRDEANQKQIVINNLTKKLEEIEQCEKELEHLKEWKEKKIQEIKNLQQRNHQLASELKIYKEQSQDQQIEIRKMENDLKEQYRKEMQQAFNFKKFQNDTLQTYQKYNMQIGQLQNKLEEAKEMQEIMKQYFKSEASTFADFSNFLNGEEIPKKLQEELGNYQNILTELNKTLNSENVNAQKLQDLLNEISSKNNLLQQEIKDYEKGRTENQIKQEEKLQRLTSQLQAQKSRVNEWKDKYKEQEEKYKAQEINYQVQEEKHQEVIQMKNQIIEKQKKQQLSIEQKNLMNIFEEKKNLVSNLINLIEQSQSDIRTFYEIIARGG